MSFLRVKPGIAGVVLEEFNTHFINPYYQSRLDANVSIEAVTSAAIVAARALHETAYGGSEVPPLKVTVASYLLTCQKHPSYCRCCTAVITARSHAPIWMHPNNHSREGILRTSLVLQVTRSAVRATVATLMGCLLMGEPGLGCTLTDKLLSPIFRGEPAHYISTLPFLGQDSQVRRLTVLQDSLHVCSMEHCTSSVLL